MFKLDAGVDCLARSFGCRTVTTAVLGSGRYFNTHVEKSFDQRFFENIETRFLFLEAGMSTAAILAYRVVEFVFLLGAFIGSMVAGKNNVEMIGRRAVSLVMDVAFSAIGFIGAIDPLLGVALYCKALEATIKEGATTDEVMGVAAQVLTSAVGLQEGIEKTADAFKFMRPLRSQVTVSQDFQESVSASIAAAIAAVCTATR